MVQIAAARNKYGSINDEKLRICWLSSAGLQLPLGHCIGMNAIIENFVSFVMAQSTRDTNDKKAIAERCLIENINDAMPNKENPAARTNSSGERIVIVVVYSFICITA
ncbi:hypothetical protein K5Q02_10565 [Pseudomonas sp. MM211]|uniref:hypothetical protein n=1 Tax=Pseudomonas sp. MM211 TaxID=2866808 RepID=UPI001CEDF35B|nr:hypothetical protein [Pseudomonas sp. MM211]UCJ18773.1 hypothetical protein K5Q02_10565 [Pseudomonas sp. MM211]